MRGTDEASEALSREVEHTLPDDNNAASVAAKLPPVDETSSGQFQLSEGNVGDCGVMCTVSRALTGAWESVTGEPKSSKKSKKKEKKEKKKKSKKPAAKKSTAKKDKKKKEKKKKKSKADDV